MARPLLPDIESAASASAGVAASSSAMAMAPEPMLAPLWEAATTTVSASSSTVSSTAVMTPATSLSPAASLRLNGLVTSLAAVSVKMKSAPAAAVPPRAMSMSWGIAKVTPLVIVTVTSALSASASLSPEGDTEKANSAVSSSSTVTVADDEPTVTVTSLSDSTTASSTVGSVSVALLESASNVTDLDTPPASADPVSVTPHIHRHCGVRRPGADQYEARVHALNDCRRRRRHDDTVLGGRGLGQDPQRRYSPEDDCQSHPPALSQPAHCRVHIPHLLDERIGIQNESISATDSNNNDCNSLALMFHENAEVGVLRV